MPQEQMVKKPRKKAQKKDQKPEFDPGMVFDVKPSEEVEDILDEESAHFRAKHGEGGDRRA